MHGGLVSFQNLVQTEVYTYPFANFVPNLVKHTDLPELIAALAPRQVVIAGSIDARGFAMKAPALSKIYAAGNVTIEAAGEWSAKSLVSYAGR